MDVQLARSPGPECVQQGAQGGALYVFAANPQGGSPLLWSLEFPYKLDSAEPAFGDLDPNDGSPRKAMVFGSWGGFLHVLWRNPDGTIVGDEFDIRSLEPGGHSLPNAVIRSSPLLADFGDGPTAVFGWMPDWTVGAEARISAVRLSADMRAGRVMFTPLWTVNRDDWKSSVTLLTVGCFGKIYAYDGATGQEQWGFQLGPRTIGTASVGDLDGDGYLEIVVPSYDGQVWVLGGVP